MLFQHTWKYVVSGQKTQTRRLAQKGDIASVDESDPNRPINKVIRTADAGVPKTLYEVGKTYSVQPGVAKRPGRSAVVVTGFKALSTSAKCPGKPLARYSR